jgi:hypothetical protein
MSDFDNQLRQRLLRLEAAVPTRSHPTRSNLTIVRSRRRTIAIVGIAAAVALAVGSIVALGSAPPPDPAQEALNAANAARLSVDLEEHWPGCLNENDAQTFVRERLNAIGLGDWTIRLDRPSLMAAPCVGADPVGSRAVLLSPSMGDRVNQAVESLKVELLSRCLDRAQAMDLLTSTLQSAGVQDPSVVVGGVRGVPGAGPDSDESKAYLQHVADGCVVFADAQADQNGRYTWSLASR